MRAVESEGITVEQAVERALILLDLTREQVDVQVVRDPTKGGSAVVRVAPRGQARSAGAARETPAAPPVARERPTPAVVSRETFGGAERTFEPSPAAAELARSLLGELLGLMDLSCRLEPGRQALDDGRIRLSIAGEDAAIVIGRQGQTLDALEFVMNRMVERRMPGSPPVTIDAEDYRDRRAQKLAEGALHEAENVRRSGRPVALEAMSPRDRRSIHIALRDEPGVATRSEGEGPFRHVIIEPTRPSDGGSGRTRLF
jgi:spoIIIJ-associated protein